MGAVGGLINNGFSGLTNSFKIMVGGFYLDENASFFGAAAKGISRYTWEYLQTSVGYSYTQVRNAFGSSIDRVDYLGGATYATNESSRHEQGITMGSYINIDQWGYIAGDFESYATSNPLYMHEYGHTIDSRAKGPSYLYIVGIPSLISASSSKKIRGTFLTTHKTKPYEKRANRNAFKYFSKHYGVSWSARYDYYGEWTTIDKVYPL